MKAFLIARVSTEDQEDALPAQIYRLEDYAKRNDFDAELFQLQESAFKEGRKLFDAVVTQIEQHKEKSAVVFDKIDRYSRDSGSNETRKLRKLCLADRIEIHFTSDHLILDSKSSANTWLMLGMGEISAEYYSRSVSDNVRRRFEQKRRDGEWTGKAPFGYVNVDLKNNKKWVEINSFTSQAVKSAYDWYASGNYSLRLIRKKLIETYSLKLSSSQIDRMLKNPFYKGEMLVEGKLYPHKYQILISDELYEQAKAVREGYAKKPTRYAGLAYPYRGLISCTACGCRITFEQKKSNKYVYGHCTQYKRKHNASYVQQDEFTNQLKAVFGSFEMPEDDFKQVHHMLKESFIEDNKTNTDKLSHIDAEIKKYQNRLDNLYDDRADRKIPDDFYERKFSEYSQLKRNLETQKGAFEQTDNTRFEDIEYLLNLFKDAPRLFEGARVEQKRPLMHQVLSNLELDGNLLRWELKEPFATAAKCKESGNWLGMRDSNLKLKDLILLV
jgi:site-specific DNA recombinase